MNTKTVVVDGVSYVPSGEPKRHFGIAVTTHNRHSVLAETLAAIEKYAPPGTPVVVVDDGSSSPVIAPDWVTLVKHQVPQGIPASKNRCIEELMRLNVEHLFLFDDDTRPDTDNWWQPYIDSGEHHLQYCWPNFTNGTPVPNMHVLHKDSRITAYGWSMGCMLYFTRHAIERCGGMRIEFGMGMEEHADLSRRVYNAGLNSFVHQDITGSAGLFYSADEHQAIKRVLAPADRKALLDKNIQIRIDHHHDAGYVEYRRPDDVVLSFYSNTFPDPQRNTTAQADPKHVAALEDSVQKVSGKKVVMFTDCLPGREPVETVHTAYRQRWITIYHWLIRHPEIRNVWCVDATDVRMLNDPFPHMQTGTLYIGWEPKTVGIQWIRDHGQALSQWIDNNQHRMLLNIGVVGGDRTTVMKFIRAMNDLWCDLQADDMHEMTFANHVVYQHFPDHVTGPQVATVFKTGTQADPVAWWAHK